jgi:iron complex transport system substrate-binding protein
VRIVSLSPSVTEILYGVGAWAQVVAVSQYCTYPPDVASKPRVSGWADTNLEQVTALKPDLVIGVDAQSYFVGEKLNALGVRSLFVKSQNLDDVLNSIRTIGKASGHESASNELAAQTEREINDVRNALANYQRPRVLCIVGRVPGTLRDLYAATRGSFLDDLLNVAGGDSVAPAAEEGYGKITKEAILAFNPEVIIDIEPETKENANEDPVAIWKELSEIEAVRKGRVYSVRDSIVTHPSQFIGYTAHLFAHFLHPDVFPNKPSKPE